MILVRNLFKKFGDVVVFDDISLRVDRGETVVLLGSSGSGKTTLLRSIVGLERFDRGSVEVDGIVVNATDPLPVLQSKLREIRMRCGFVFQQFNLFPHLTVLRNLTLAPNKVKGEHLEITTEHSRKLLEQVGMLHKADMRPGRLSGGEQQRVAIARAMAMQPDYLLYDEPTSSLDPTRCRELWTLMGELAEQGQTQVIVTHQTELTKHLKCRVVRMNDGRIDADTCAA